MADILTQDEINDLLTAISGGDDEDKIDYSNMRRIKIYDFKRPDKIDKLTMRILERNFEEYAKKLSLKISQLTGTHFHAFVASIDELTYEEFVRSIPIGDPVCEVSAYPLEGTIVVETDGDIARGIEKAVTGKNKKPAPPFIVQSMLALIANELETAFDKYEKIYPKTDDYDINSQKMTKNGPCDMVCLISLDGSIGENSGMINICIPYTTIKPIIEKIRMESKGTKSSAPNSLNLNSIEFSARAVLGPVEMDASDLTKIRVGDVIGFSSISGFFAGNKKFCDIEIPLEEGSQKKRRKVIVRK